METLHTFEGTELGEVLAQVHARLGADAEIVSAAKVRRGGVGGFFAKQVFVVEARSMKRPDIAVRAARHIADEPGGVLAALLAMADERSAQEGPTAARVAAAGAAASGAGSKPTGDMPAREKAGRKTSTRSDSGASADELAAPSRRGVEMETEMEQEQLALPAAPAKAKRADEREAAPSYDSIFERALAMSEELRRVDDARRLEELRRIDEASRLDETHRFAGGLEIDLEDALVDISGPDDGVVDLTRVTPRRSGGISPRPPAERKGGLRPAAQHPASPGSPSSRSAGGQPILTPSTPNTSTGSEVPASGERNRGERRIRPAAEVLPHVDRNGREVRPGAIATLDMTDLRDQVDLRDRVVHERQVPAVVSRAPMTPDPSVVRGQENVAALLALGLPREFCDVDELTVRALSTPLEALRYAPAGVEQATGVVAVVGGMPKVRRLSTYLAGDATLACREMPSDLAAWLWIPDVGEARHRRSRWSWRERPVVVGVEGSPASSLRPYCMEMLRTLAPTSLRVIVEAAWSLDAMHHWTNELASLGVPMALDVVGVEDAAEPASVLHLGLPVATLDGLPANAQGWASILIERIGEDED